jgi:capsid protein
VQLQILEIDYLDTNKNQMAPDNSGNYIINGIEYNSLGRVVNYWLFDQHPGDISVTSMMRRTESNAVSAKNVIHFYSADRPGQGRGIPRLAPVIPKIRDVMTLEDAELQRKNLETRLSVLTSGDVSSMALSSSPGLDEVRSTGELGDLASGSIIQLPPGSSMSVVEPKAAPGFVEYMKYQMHLIASGMGIEYHMMVGDASEGNFSSTRALTIEFRRLAEQEQWLEVIPNLCDKMLNVFFDYAVLAGKLPVEVDRRVDWSTPKWDYVNPKDDVKADLDEIAGGLSSFSEKLRRRGYKPDIVFNELEQDIKTLKDKGVLEVMIAMQGKGGMNNQPGAVSGKDKPADKSREMPDTRMFDMVESVVRMAMEGKEGKEQQPNITVSPNLSIDSRDFEKAAIDFFARMEDQMKIVVNVPEQAPIVNFNPEIRVEPSKVEVQQPVVNVEVKPADVAYMHPRSASARHIRDDKGEIVETVTEYKK